MGDNRALFGKRDVYVLLASVLIAGLAAVVAYVVTEPGPAEPTGTPVARISPSPTSSPLPPATTPPAPTPSHTPVVTPTATPCAPPEGWVPYTVQPGEGLYRIALRYGMTAGELAAANCLPSADEIQAGQQISVPYPVTPTPTPCSPPAGWVLYTVQPGENLFRVALRYGMTAEELARANCMDATEALLAGTSIRVPYLVPPTAVPQPVLGGGNQGQGGAAGGLETVPGLLDEIFFSGGGGGDVPLCDEPEAGVTLPTIIATDRLLDMGLLCLYGFPIGEEGTVELYAPDGHLAGTATFRVTAPFDPLSPTLEVVYLWWPAGLPLGTWRAVAQTASTIVETPFEVPPWEQAAVSTVPSADIDTTEIYFCGSYDRGETVFVYGTNQPPNRALPLAVYRQSGSREDGDVTGSLVRSQIVVTNGRGDFSSVLRVAASDLPGRYLVVPVVDVTRQDYELDWLSQRMGCYTVP